MKSIDIDNLALLARLTIPENEKADFTKDFQAILEYVNQIQDAQISSQITTHDLVNVLREDTQDPVSQNLSGSYTEKLVGLSPDREGDYIKVKKIL